MAGVLDKGLASKLRNSLQATPGISADLLQDFAKLLDGLRQPGTSEAEAESRLREWLKKAPGHAAAVVRSAALGSRYMRTLPADSWILRAFGVVKE